MSRQVHNFITLLQLDRLLTYLLPYLGTYTGLANPINRLPLAGPLYFQVKIIQIMMLYLTLS